MFEKAKRIINISKVVGLSVALNAVPLTSMASKDKDTDKDGGNEKPKTEVVKNSETSVMPQPGFSFAKSDKKAVPPKEATIKNKQNRTPSDQWSYVYPHEADKVDHVFNREDLNIKKILAKNEGKMPIAKNPWKNNDEFNRGNGVRVTKSELVKNYNAKKICPDLSGRARDGGGAVEDHHKGTVSTEGGTLNAKSK